MFTAEVHCTIACRFVTLFAYAGRALPYTQWLLYILYTVALVVPLIRLLPGYADIGVFAALKLPVSTLGERMNSVPDTAVQHFRLHERRPECRHENLGFSSMLHTCCQVA